MKTGGWRLINFVDERVTDAFGNDITLFDVSISGDLVARYKDSGEVCSAVMATRLVYLNLVPYEVSVAPEGGIRVRQATL